MIDLLKHILQRALLCALLIFILWFGGFAWYLLQVPRAPANDSFQADAIVVLTGGSGRIEYGLSLLRQGRAERIFITGVESRISAGELAAKYRLPAASSRTITLGYHARNTIGNAMETAEWVQHEHIQSLRLVTANYHMPRALIEFRHAMPDIAIIPDAVIPDDFDADRWWRFDASLSLLLSEYHKCIAALLRHHFIAVVEDKK